MIQELIASDLLERHKHYIKKHGVNRRNDQNVFRIYRHGHSTINFFFETVFILDNYLW